MHRSNRLLRGALLVLAFGSLVGAIGCGAALTAGAIGALLATGGRGSKGNALPASNQPSQVQAAAISGSTTGGAATLDLTISDLEGDATNVQVRYSTDPNENAASAFKNAATGTFTAPGSSTPLDATRLPASSGGTSYVFTWNTAADVGTSYFAAVRLQILLDGVVTFTVPAFAVDNTAVPVVMSATFGSLPSGATAYTDDQNSANGTTFIPVRVVVASAQSQAAKLSVLFGNGSFPSRNVAVGEFFDASGQAVSTSPTLPTSPGGTVYTFRWSSASNGISFPTKTQLQFVATSPTGRASAALPTDAVTVENSQVSVAVGTPSGVQSDKVEVGYQVTDAIGDGSSENVDLTVQWATSANGPWSPATSVDEPPTSGTTSLSSSASGSAHTFIWNAFADIQAYAAAHPTQQPPGVPVDTVVLSFTVTKPRTGVSSFTAVTSPFHFDGRLINTVVGRGVGAAEDVPATSVPFHFPNGIAADATRIYVCDLTAGRVRAIDRASGTVSTFFGGGTETADGALGKDYALSQPRSVAIGDGGLFVSGLTASGQARIFRVDLQSTVVTTLVANRGPGYPTGALSPQGVAFDPATSTVYFADLNDYGPGGSPQNPACYTKTGTSEMIFGVPSTGGIPTAVVGGAGGTTPVCTNGAKIADAVLGTVADLHTSPDFPNALFFVDTSYNEVRVANLDPTASVFVAGTTVLARHVAKILPNLVTASGTESSARYGGVAIEAAGIIDVSDMTNAVVYQVNDTGAVKVVAGSRPGFSGDGGQALQAQLALPTRLAADPNPRGSPESTGFFVSDLLNTRVRRVDDTGTGAIASGVITTVGGTFAPIGDGSLAIAATLSVPSGVAGLGGARPRVIISDALHQRIRAVDKASLAISTFAGDGTSTLSGDGLPATSAGIGLPGPVVVDGSGNVYVAQPQDRVVRRIAAGTTITSTVVGNPTAPIAVPVDGTAAGTAALASASGIALLNGNVLVVADGGARRIYGVALNAPATVLGVNLTATNEIFTLAGTGASTRGLPAPGASGTPARGFAFGIPVAVAATSTGTRRIWVVDEALNEVFTVDDTGTLFETAGSGAALGYAAGTYDSSHPQTGAGTGVPAVGAALSAPTGALYDDATGALFVVDTGNDLIHVVGAGASQTPTILGVGATDVGNIQPVAGSGPTQTGTLTGDSGPALQAGLALARLGGTPAQSLLFSGGTLFFSDVGNDRVRAIDDSGTIHTFAGGGFLDGDDGPADFASITLPTAIACASDGSYAVLDLGRIRVVSPKTTIIDTVVGTGVSQFVDGPVNDAAFSYADPPLLSQTQRDTSGPRAMAFAPLSVIDSSVIVVADTRSNTIRLANLTPGPVSVGGALTVPGGELRTILGDASKAHAPGWLANGLTISASTAAVASPEGVCFSGSNLVVFTHSDSATPRYQIRAINVGSQPVSVTGWNGAAATPLTIAPGTVQTLVVLNKPPHQVAAYVNGASMDLVWCQEPDGSLAGRDQNANVLALPLAAPLAASTGEPDPYGLPAASLPVLPGTIAVIATSNIVFGAARGVSVDPRQGDVWVCDRTNSVVYGIQRADGVPYPVGLRGNPGFSGDGGLASQAQINGPVGTAVDPFGNVFVIDGNNLKIRRARRYP